MTNETTVIADRVREIARQERLTQGQVGAIVGVSRQAVNARYQGNIAWTAPEILRLAQFIARDVADFYPHQATPTADPEPPAGFPPAVGVTSSSLDPDAGPQSTDAAQTQ